MLNIVVKLFSTELIKKSTKINLKFIIMLFHLLFISFSFVSTDSIDNLGGDEFDEGGGVGGAPKDVEGGPDSISGPT